MSELYPLISLMYDGVDITESFTNWYIPCMLVYFLLFFLLFECICNLYAEISGFEDRQFYQDFWNATNFDEYARKWNRLVHEFLHRHVYLDLLKRTNMSIFQALVATFTFSLFFHEIFFTVMYKRTSFYLTGLQVYQLLLIFAFAKLKGTMLGNMLFWGG